MTRALHKDTRVQRSDHGDLPKAAVERGYEAGDAPPAKVAMGVAAFVAVMFVGMAAAGLLANAWSGTHLPSTAAATRDTHQPPPPRLLANPAQQRRQIEAEAQRRLREGRMPIDAAMARVAERGWGEDATPTSTEAIARGHVGGAE